MKQKQLSKDTAAVPSAVFKNIYLFSSRQLQPWLVTGPTSVCHLYMRYLQLNVSDITNKGEAMCDLCPALASCPF